MLYESSSDPARGSHASVCLSRGKQPDSCPWVFHMNPVATSAWEISPGRGNFGIPRGIFFLLELKQHIRMGLAEASKNKLNPIPG